MMHAISFSALGGPEVLKYQEVQKPKPKEHEVLVKLEYAGINHVDIHFRRGIPGIATPLPHIPGADGAGTIAEIGSMVKDRTIGERVVIQPMLSCMNCVECKAGRRNYCHAFHILGEHKTDGTYAQYVSIPAYNAFPLPPSIEFETAASMGIAYLTAWGMLVSKAQVKKGDKVLIMGAGSGVGMAAIQIAKHFGAHVITTASSDEKLEKAKTLLGADETFNYTKVDLAKEIRIRTEKKGVDIVIEHVGGRQWVPILKATKNGGTIVTCGATDGFDPQTDLRHIFYRQLRILGSTMGTDQELKEIITLLAEKKLSPIIDKIFPLEHAAQAQEYIQDRKVFGKVLLQIPA
ncbi:MAG: zinc-binding dehydrogenase [Bdellovibrionales bacterium]|nr:zinc-binding dehydrogenase [Bdellovibrionales bacterium]